MPGRMPPYWSCQPPPVVSSCSSMRVRLPISCLSHPRPQKSAKAPMRVEARMELVPSPEPAGMADRRVISMPEPKAESCWWSEVYCSAQNCGRNPQSASAALGMEKGEPTLLYCPNSS